MKGRFAIPFLAAAILALLTGARLAAQEGTLVVVNKRADAAQIIDIASGEVLQRIPTGAGPHEVVITADGSRAVVTDYGGRGGGSTLTVINVPARNVARKIDLGDHRRPHGVAFLAGDELIAVTSEESRHVVIVRIADGEIVSAIPTGHGGSHMLAIPTAGAPIFTSNMDDATVSELDPAAGTHERTIGVGPRPEAIGAAPDGREVWVGSNDDGTITAIHTASGETETVADGFGWPYRILFTADGSQVIIPDLEHEVVRFIDRETREEVGRMAFPGAGPQGVTLSADGKTLFLALSRIDEVVLIDLETRAEIRRLTTGSGPDGVAYSAEVLTGR